MLQTAALGAMQTDISGKQQNMREDKDREGQNERLAAWRRYIHVGVTAFAVVVASIIVFFVFERSDEFSGVLSDIWSALEPVVVGAGIAYVVTPLMNMIEKGLRWLMRKAKKPERARKAARGISVPLTMIIVLCIIAFLMYLLIPNLISTVSGLAAEMPGQIRHVTEWADSVSDDGTMLGRIVESAGSRLSSYFGSLMDSELTDYVSKAAAGLATGVSSVFGTIYDIVIGLVFSIYFLTTKETLAAQSKKLIYSIFKKEKADRIVFVTRACHRKFTGAISGKILDSAIVGILCFIGMSIFRFPYASLISVIVGVTNVIPFFGPYIGAVPSALLILFVSPIKCLWFVVFIIILQQLDCNVIDPRVVGGSIGLSPFWVLFACVVFGSLWGLIGMLLGVPLMACIYMLVKEAAERRLEIRGLCTDTRDYLSPGLPDVYKGRTADDVNKSGPDTAGAGAGADTVGAGSDADTVGAGADADAVGAGSDADTAVAGAGTDTAGAGAGADTAGRD